MSFTHLGEGNHKARKQHICEWCGEAIEAGELYHWFSGTCDGDFQYTKLHPECDQAMKRDMKADPYGDYFFDCDNERGQKQKGGGQ